MKKTFAALVFGSFALVSPGHAAVVYGSVGGSTLAAQNYKGAVAGSTYIDFEDVLPGTSGNFTSGGYQFSVFTGNGGAAAGAGIQNSNVSGKYAPPAGDTSRYLTTGFNGEHSLVEEQVSFGKGYTKFGLYWGSFDKYNTISFLHGNTVIESYTGFQIYPPANGNQSADSTNRYVNFEFTNGDWFDGVRFSSTLPAFEVDNLAIAGAIPEASTWAMMVLGLAGLGSLGWLRSRRDRTLATTGAG